VNKPMPKAEPSLIIYDGDCIFCANYVRLLRLRQSIGKVELLNARSDDPRVKDYWGQGYDLNRGMLFVHAGRVYHGDEAINVLASLSSDSTVFNRVNGLVLSNARTARMVYPFLKFGRRVVLLLRGKRLLRHPVDDFA
jgi:predicted DCC family thiol-disulfide oxidoreductase YuxK